MNVFFSFLFKNSNFFRIEQMGIRGLFPYHKSHPRANQFMETIPFLKGPDDFLFTQNKKVIVDTPSIFQVFSIEQCFEMEQKMSGRFPNAQSVALVLDGTRHPLKKVKNVDISNSVMVECTRPSKISVFRCMPNPKTDLVSTIFKAPYEGESLAAGLASCDPDCSVVVSTDSDALVLCSGLKMFPSWFRGPKTRKDQSCGTLTRY